MCVLSSSLHLLVLDDEWRPLDRLRADHDWRGIVDRLLRWDSRWVALDQQRTGISLPGWADIHLTRSLSKRLRPIEIALADHVIHAGNNHFSFREAGLL
ncbi:JAB domain-containing protein [Sphingobium chungbukense]|uniref:DNA repair protein RadC n=1 Tax=Sphingobium chungbukense TaxID=56193 RepID=A0A0M3APY6_9SPHN|nr:JAB domain-containing protein [Sphingobium chungbukense]KKW90986.1 DNA repair protein RadC [Sphingobium chungbukense]